MAEKIENEEQQETPNESASTETAAPVPNGTPEPAGDTHVEPDTNNKAAREAAKYRKQLRDTEKQLQAAHDALSAARTHILTTALAGHQVGSDTFNTAAMQDAEIDVNSHFTSDGTLDTDALNATMQKLHQDKPYLFTPPQKLIIPNEGNSPESGRSSNAWQDAFAPEQ